MFETLPRWLVRAALCTSAMAAQAQGVNPANTASPAPAARPDPLDPRASVPVLSYRSPFLRYRGLGDDKPVSWTEANATVARIGGWRVYAREAQQPGATPSGIDAPASPQGAGKDTPQPMPMAPGHPGHPSR